MDDLVARTPFLIGAVALVCGLLLALSGAGPFSSGCWTADDVPGTTTGSSLSVVPPGEQCEAITPDGQVVTKVTFHARDLFLAIFLAAAIGLLFWPLRERSLKGVMKAGAGIGACLLLTLMLFL